MARQRILLTGACGYIAGQLLPAFSERYELTLLDNRSDVDGVRSADLLADDEDQLREHFTGIDTVVHTAYLRVRSDNVQAEYENQRRNVDMTQRVYQLALDAGVRRVVVASTNQAAKWYEQPYFAGLKDRVGPEEYPRPDNLYGWAKAAYESLGFLYACGSLGRPLEMVQVRIVAPRELDPAVYADLPRERYVRDLAGYISERDLQQLFCKSIDAPHVEDEYGVPFQIFYGVSNNARTFWSITNARKVIGYAPQDDSEVRYAQDIARLLP